MLLIILIIAHFIADFYLQSENMAKNKKEYTKVLLAHCAIYAVIFALVNGVFIEGKFTLLATLIIAISHLIVDFIKIKVDNKTPKYSVWFYTFTFDQILHIGVITATYKLLDLAQNTTVIYSKCLRFDKVEEIVVYALLFAFLLKPVGVFIYKLLPCLLKEKHKIIFDDIRDTIPTHKFDNIIGQLERMIIAILLLCGQYSAIGLVLTAKSIARFKQLEDKTFAEQYLIGTLISLAIALVTTMAVKYFLPQITLVAY